MGCKAFLWMLLLLPECVMALTPGSVKWQFDVQGNVTYAPTVASDGNIYVNADDSHLWSVSSSGTKQWAFPIPNARPAYGAPVVTPDGSTIYIACGEDKSRTDYTIVAYSLSSAGRLNWKSTLLDSGAGFTSYYAQPYLASDGSLYTTIVKNDTAGVATNFVATKSSGQPLLPLAVTNKLTGLLQAKPNTLNNTYLKNFTVLPIIPAITAAALTVVAPYGAAATTSNAGYYLSRFSINPSGSDYVGKHEWQTDAGVLVSPAALSPLEPVVYYGSQDGYLYAVNSLTGQLRWRKQLLGDLSLAAPQVASNGTIYVASGNGYVYSILPDSTNQWEAIPTQAGVLDKKVALTKNATFLAVTGEDGNVYALDLSTGKLVWQAQGLDATSPPAISPDGSSVYVAQYKTLLAIASGG